MKRRPYYVPAGLLAIACRFGGPEGSATELSEVDAGRTAATTDTDPELEERDEVADEAPDLARDAEPAPSTSTADAAVDPTAESPGATCWASAGLACDPVSGLGCLPLMQCVIDPSSSSTATHCVFGGLQLDVTCAEDALSTNCPPLHSCVMGTCRKYCCGDADCEVGARCVGTNGAAAFKLCQALTP